MGLMNSMRNRGGLLVFVIGLAIVAFLVGDLLTSGQGLFGANPTEVGSIEGREIGIDEFQAKLDLSTEQYKKNSGQESLNETMTGYLVDQTWNQVVYDALLAERVKKSNVTVSPEELFDMIQGTNPHPEVRRAFTNTQTGIFDPSQVIAFLNSMDQQDPSGETRKQWITFEKAIKEERVRQKYMNLVKTGLYVPTTIAKAGYMEQNKTANIKYVLIDYTTVSDSAVKVEESDIKNYYNANKYKYKQAENTRSFEYIYVDVLPSKDDTADTKRWIEDQLEGLKTASDDSTYINLNAETKYFGTYAKRGELPAALDTIMFSKPEGFIYGPYIDGGAYKVAKIVSVKSLPDSVRVRHILINPGNDPVAARAKADSIKKALDEGANFAALALQFSTDGTREMGGDLGYFDNKRMVKPFSDFSFEGNVGKRGVVASQFGFHVAEILDQKNFSKQISVGVIDRLITPSNSTTQALYSKANGSLSGISNADEFNNIKLENGFNKRVAEDIKENDRFVAGLENPRELVRWAYKADVGDISPLFELGNKYVFATLTKVKDKGTVPMEYVKAEIENAVRKEKKAEVLKNRFTAVMGGNADIDQIAQKLGNVAQPSIGLNFSFPVIPGISREPELVGKVFGSDKGKLIGPVTGERGVYVALVENFTDALPLPDYSPKKMDLMNSYKGRVDGELFEALKKSANIKDNRVRFY